MNDKIEVQKDGVKLGWNLTAIIGSVGLALYVSSVVSPLLEKITSSKNQGAINKVAIENLSKSFMKFESDITGHRLIDDYRDESLSKSVEKLRSDIEELKGNRHEK